VSEKQRELLIKLLRDRSAIQPEPSASPQPGPGSEIAIVGLSGRYPESPNLPQFWNNLKSGRNCTGQVPEDRWDWRAHYDPASTDRLKSYSKWGGFLQDVDKFDPLFFSIAPAEAETIDPQERLFLETVWALFEDAGTTRRDLDRWGHRVGVFVGVTNSHYSFLGGTALARGESTAARSAFWSVANRISYVFDLDGPSMAVDTACSASLTAVHLACESIQRGECQAAVAGGVNLILHPQHLVRLSAANMLASSEKCQSFGAGADGFVDGEGVGAVLLRPLDQAIADGDQIYAVIKGSSINHGGKTSGYTVPNPNAQGALVKEALTRAGVDPRTVGLIEAHGTGTALGDPIEIAGLIRAFASHSSERQFCSIGSVKSNIGHLESAAGIAGLTKVLLQMKHGQLAPSIHTETLNPKIDFEASPFYVQRELTSWDRRVVDGATFPRRAGVSSFGAGGANAHVILEEYQNSTSPSQQQSGPWLFVLSAQTEERLRSYSQTLANFLRQSEKTSPLEKESVRTELLQALARVLNVSEDNLDSEVSFQEEYALDAIALNGFAAIVEQQYEKALTPADFLQYPTIDALVSYIAGSQEIEPSGHRDPSPGLGDIAYTLQVGREAMAQRLAVVASSRSELTTKLGKFADEDSEVEQLYCGRAPVSTDGDTGKLLANRQLDQLAKLWVSGVEVEWRRLYGDPGPRRISLPTYPFARERYWTPEERPVQSAGQWLHPLLQRNTSDLSGPRFSTTFTGQEFFLADHVVNGQRILPGAAYLEMARAAAQQVGGPKSLYIRNVVWARPVVVGDQALEVHIRLTLADNERIEFEVYSDPGNEGTVVYSQGCLVPGPASPGPRLDLAAFQAQCQQGRLSSEQFYGSFEECGIDYGPGHRGVEFVEIGADLVLAKLSLPASISNTEDSYVLHPSLLDSAVQASIGLSFSPGQSSKPALAFALQEVEIFRPCEADMWVLIRDRNGKLDLDLCDLRGEVCVRMKGLSSRAVEGKLETVASQSTAEHPLVGDLLLAPVWDTVSVTRKEPFPSLRDDIVIIGGNAEVLCDIQHHYPQARTLDIDPGDSVAEIARKLDSVGSLDHLIWIAPRRASADLIEEQRRGALQLFRIVKALLDRGYGTRELGWSVFTTQTQAVYKLDEVDPTHATLHGLVGALAKEHPNWPIRHIDLEAERSWPTPRLFRLPPDPHGNCLAYRDDQWLQLQLVPWLGPTGGRPLYRQGGVYVVLGGAGGLGQAWTEYMIRTYAAKIIWLGRRQQTEEIEASLQALGALGPTPEYYAADATDHRALERVYREVKTRHQQIHGLLHTAVVGTQGSLAESDEKSFISGLSAKIDASVNLVRVFGAEPLDFVLFFSSINAFLKAKRTASYASGCTFADAFAHHLSRQLPCPVKVMDWGYWGSVGQIADSKMYKSWMAYEGLVFIEPAEAMDVLETLLAGPADRLCFVKTTKPIALDGLPTNEEKSVVVYDQAVPSSMEAVRKVPMRELQFSDAGSREVDLHLAKLLAGQLQMMGLFSDDSPVLADLYDRWLEASFAFLPSDMESVDLSVAWRSWEKNRQAWLDDPALKAQVRLVERTLRALPDVLTGQRLATDILFPNSSLELVEGIFKENPAADYLNETLADAVVAYVSDRIDKDPAAEIRILEVGAGTGGTSATLLARLEPYREHLKEYCYTDVARSFLWHAEQAYGTTYPYLTTRVFDVEAPIDEQGLTADSYDVVVAANVLHATKYIRRTLRHVKTALHKRGLLVMNEVSDKNLATHLTFGLLEGWWLADDLELRIPGSPGLYPETWQRVLHSEGFCSVWAPTLQASLGSQIIVAESDGVVLNQTQPKRVLRAPQPSRQRPPAANESHVLRHVAGVVTQKLSEILKMNAARIQNDTAFAECGLDSIFGVSFVKVLNHSLGIQLETTCIFDYSSVRELSAHIVSEYKDELTLGLKLDAHVEDPPKTSRYASPETKAEPDVNVVNNDGIAVIGMAGQFPNALDVDAFWQNMLEGHQAASKIGAAGGALEERDCFDPLFFSISPREASSMNPHQRLILQESWKALEDAGYNPRALSNCQVGTFIGAEPSGYQSDSFTGSSDAIIASRLAYTLNLQGPAMVVNTGCSSSGVAIHLACESLRSGESTMALAGGVFANLDDAALSKMAEIGMLSPTGRCRTFDAASDGTVISEGVGVVVLKRLDQALADGDPIYGVIQGSGVNQDGASNGITAPSGAAQERLITSVYERFNIDPQRITYVEAHGTGTKLGDPIEANALIRAFRQYTDKREYCALGSAKSHIGHTAAAAAVVGLIKVLLSLRHRKLPGLLHLETPNPHIALEDSAFYLPTQAREWRSAEPLTAALNSFGHGGTNVHLVVRETTLEERSPQTRSGPDIARLFPLSAKNPDRLREYTARLLKFLRGSGQDLDLAPLAYTLQAGREAMAERVVFLAENIPDLLAKLEQFHGGKEGFADCWRGKVKTSNDGAEIFNSDTAMSEAMKQWAAHGELRKIAELWTLGFAVDWSVLYERPPIRLRLPTYPFARERYGRIPCSPVPASQKSRPEPKQSPEDSLVGNVMLVPFWDAISPPAGLPFPSPDERAILIGDTRGALGKHFPEAHNLELGPDDGVDTIARKLKTIGTIDHIVWSAPRNQPISVAEDELIEAQERGVIALFRLLKALLQVGYGKRALRWTVITIQAQPVGPGDRANPCHASLSGFVGSMAKEHPNWKIRLVDLETDYDWPIEEMFALAADPRGDARVYRNGQWHAQRLVPLQNSKANGTILRSQGVYVVIGGAGGIGAVWSEHMIRTHQAQVVWIGRRPKDAAIQAEIDKLSALGPAPLYITADATDRAALQQAYKEIKARYSHIHGVVHSAIVLSDRSLAHMEETQFRSALSAKVDVCVRMAQVFRDEPLDFVLFFSAAMSFLKAPGLANYAAGCTFKDAFAHQLAREWPCAVKVINWGYWGSVGIVASQTVRDRMASVGIDSIEPPEAMDCLEVLLSGPVDQIALMKTSDASALEPLNTSLEEELTVYPESLPSVIENLKCQVELVES
jgi:polyketide synthase PksM